MTKGEDALDYLKQEIKAMWPEQDRRLNLAETGPTVVLVTGVNGAGKTTSIAKIARQFKADGKTVLLGACDTFRAGAVRRSRSGPSVWTSASSRSGRQRPAAVAFDACSAGVARGVDVIILDTAGRLQTRAGLMDQLSKIKRVATKQIPDAPTRCCSCSTRPRVRTPCAGPRASPRPRA